MEWRRIYGITLPTKLSFLISLQVHDDKSARNSSERRRDKPRLDTLSSWVCRELYLICHLKIMKLSLFFGEAINCLRMLGGLNPVANKHLNNSKIVKILLAFMFTSCIFTFKYYVNGEIYESRTAVSPWTEFNLPFRLHTSERGSEKNEQNNKLDAKHSHSSESYGCSFVCCTLNSRLKEAVRFEGEKQLAIIPLRSVRLHAAVNLATLPKEASSVMQC